MDDAISTLVIDFINGVVSVIINEENEVDVSSAVDEINGVVAKSIALGVLDVDGNSSAVADSIDVLSIVIATDVSAVVVD